MRLINTTDAVVVVATPGAHYATLKPGEVVAMSDDMRDDSTIASMIGSGFLKEIKSGQPIPKIIPIAKQNQTHISLIKSQEVQLDNSTVVSRIKTGRDVTKMNIPGVNIEEADGTMLIKSGSKSSKPAKIFTVSPKQAEQRDGNKTKIIKQVMQTKEAALGMDNGEAMIIVPSDVPGQGKAVPMSKLTMEQLERIKDQTTNVLESAKKQKKQIQIINTYQGMDVEKRKSLIDNATDVDTLATMAKLEKSGALIMKIRSKIKKLSTTEE